MKTDLELRHTNAEHRPSSAGTRPTFPFSAENTTLPVKINPLLLTLPDILDPNRDERMQRVHNHYYNVPAVKLAEEITHTLGMNGTPFAAVMKDLGEYMDAHARHANHNPYHNIPHFKSVPIEATRLIQANRIIGETPFSPEQEGAIIVVAFGHDLAHTGGVNNSSFEMEKRTWEVMQPILEKHGIDPNLQKQMEAALLSTSLFDKGKLVDNPAWTTETQRMAQIVQWADISLSIGGTEQQAIESGKKFGQELREHQCPDVARGVESGDGYQGFKRVAGVQIYDDGTEVIPNAAAQMLYGSFLARNTRAVSNHWKHVHATPLAKPASIVLPASAPA